MVFCCIFTSVITTKLTAMTDLNTISLEDLQTEIICNDDLRDFYPTLDEKRFLNGGYSREELVDLLENWLTVNSEY